MAKARVPGVETLNQLLGGGCCGAGSGAVFTASSRGSAAVADKAKSREATAKKQLFRRSFAAADPNEFTLSRLIVSPCRIPFPAPSTPKIRQTASVKTSEIGEHGGNALDRLAYQGEITSSRRFANLPCFLLAFYCFVFCCHVAFLYTSKEK